MTDLAKLRELHKRATEDTNTLRYTEWMEAREALWREVTIQLPALIVELEQLRAENATLRAAQKACEHCDDGVTAVSGERAREIAEAMPSGMLEMSNADYWTAQINAAITLAVQQERARCMAELAECRRDVERLNNGVVIGTYTGKDGRRDWWSGGTWLHKGEQVVVIDDAGAEGKSVPCNLPFERLPQHAADPGFGPVPPRPNVTNIHQQVCCMAPETCTVEHCLLRQKNAASAEGER